MLAAPVWPLAGWVGGCYAPAMPTNTTKQGGRQRSALYMQRFKSGPKGSKIAGHLMGANRLRGISVEQGTRRRVQPARRYIRRPGR